MLSFGCPSNSSGRDVRNVPSIAQNCLGRFRSQRTSGKIRVQWQYRSSKRLKIGGYLLKQKLLGRKRYPLVLMLEPLFRCNLACAGCGKIDYPDAILNRRMTAQECWDAADECGAPMVAIPGGEPLIHKEIGEIVRGLVARKKFVSLCTNALLLEKKLHLFEPSPYLFFSVHLDGLTRASRQVGVPGRRVRPRGVRDQGGEGKGFTVNVNATIFDNHPAEEIAKFLDFCKEIGVGVSLSPGYAYERAPDQEHFLNRQKTKQLFRDVFALGKGKKWNFIHSGLFLDFLAGNQELRVHAVGHAGAQHLRLAEALLSARRRLREDLQGADGDHRLGFLRHRQVRKVRRLHGALRLRADRGARCGQESAEGDEGRDVRRPDHGADGAGDRSARSSARRSTSSPSRCRRSCQRSAATRLLPRVKKKASTAA